MTETLPTITPAKLKVNWAEKEGFMLATVVLPNGQPITGSDNEHAATALLRLIVIASRLGYAVQIRDEIVVNSIYVVEAARP